MTPKRPSIKTRIPIPAVAPDPNALSDALKAVWERVSDNIAIHGHSITGVFGDDSSGTPPFSYTIGLANAGLPEIIISGLDNHTAANLLNGIAESLRSGASPDETTAFDEIANVPLYLRRLKPGSIGRSHMLMAADYSAEKAQPRQAMQLVYPDPDGRFPWDPTYHFPWQELLF